MIFSVNNKLIVEVYTKEGLRAEVRGGIATPGQRDGLKGLKVLVDYRPVNGEKVLGQFDRIPKGSTVYIKEETLHNFAWATKAMSSPFLPVKFMLTELQFVEAIEIPDETPGDAA